MIDWAIVGVTTVVLLAVIGTIRLVGYLITKCIDMYIDVNKKVNNLHLFN